LVFLERAGKGGKLDGETKRTDKEKGSDKEKETAKGKGTGEEKR
jgi:hypothetical protein